MRNPNRIYPLCNRLASLWTLYPDLRFGQLIQLLVEYDDSDPFFWEDDKWDQAIKYLQEQAS